ADFAANEGHRRQPRSSTQPTGEDDSFAQLPGFSCQKDEDRLRDFLGLMRIARVAQRDGIDLIDVPRNERGKSFLRAVLDVFLQQNAVVQFQHLQVNAADQGKVTASGRKKLSSNHSNSSSTSPAKSVGVENPADCP